MERINFDNEQSMENGIQAINKFMSFSWNYPMKEVVYKNSYFDDEKLITVPSFIADVKWTFGLTHAVEKWKQATLGYSTNTPMAFIPRFYSELDSTNRRKFLQYVLENYDDEIKI